MLKAQSRKRKLKRRKKKGNFVLDWIFNYVILGFVPEKCWTLKSEEAEHVFSRTRLDCYRYKLKRSGLTQPRNKISIFQITFVASGNDSVNIFWYMINLSSPFLWAESTCHAIESYKSVMLELLVWWQGKSATQKLAH